MMKRFVFIPCYKGDDEIFCGLSTDVNSFMELVCGVDLFIFPKGASARVYLKGNREKQ